MFIAPVYGYSNSSKNVAFRQTPNIVNSMSMALSSDTFVKSQNNLATAKQDPLYVPSTRKWGSYTVIARGNGFAAKTITVEPKQKLSYQSHDHRAEHWVVASGEATVYHGVQAKDLAKKYNTTVDKLKLPEQELIKNLKKDKYTKGASVDLALDEVHSLQNESDKPLTIIELQMGDILKEEDIYRFADMYGRS